jgi:hypothetical protein
LEVVIPRPVSFSGQVNAFIDPGFEFCKMLNSTIPFFREPVPFIVSYGTTRA